MSTPQDGVGGGDSVETTGQAKSDRKMLIEEVVGKLSPFERRLIWMRFYDDQTLEEISHNVKLRREQIQAALKVAIYKMRVHLS